MFSASHVPLPASQALTLGSPAHWPSLWFCQHLKHVSSQGLCTPSSLGLQHLNVSKYHSRKGDSGTSWFQRRSRGHSSLHRITSAGSGTSLGDPSTPHPKRCPLNWAHACFELWPTPFSWVTCSALLTSLLWLHSWPSCLAVSSPSVSGQSWHVGPFSQIFPVSQENRESRLYAQPKYRQLIQ